MNPSEDKNLGEKLARWKVAQPLPPGFQDRVWRNIERTQNAAPVGAWQWCQAWLERAFARQLVALAYIALLLFFGLTAGYLGGQARERHLTSQLASSYVQSVDPNQHNHI